MGSPVVLSTKTRPPPEVANGCANNYTWGVPWDLLLFRLGEKLREQNVHVQNFQRCKNTRTRIRGGIKSFMFFFLLKMNLLLLWSKKRCDLRISTSNFKRLLIVRENGNGVNRSISWVGVKSDIGNFCEIKRFTHRKKTQVSWLNW